MTRGEVVRLVNSAARLLANVVCFQMMLQLTYASIKTLAFYMLNNNREPIFLTLYLQKAANLKLKHRSALEEEQQRAERAERRKKRRERRQREREEEQHEPPEDEMTETAMSKHGRGAPPAFRICVALTYRKHSIF